MWEQTCKLVDLEVGLDWGQRETTSEEGTGAGDPAGVECHRASVGEGGSSFKKTGEFRWRENFNDL